MHILHCAVSFLPNLCRLPVLKFSSVPTQFEYNMNYQYLFYSQSQMYNFNIKHILAGA
jgi:hypothetical protein